MKKIRILEAIRQGKIGGGETHVLELVSTIDKSVKSKPRLLNELCRLRLPRSMVDVDADEVLWAAPQEWQGSCASPRSSQRSRSLWDIRSLREAQSWPESVSSLELVCTHSHVDFFACISLSSSSKYSITMDIFGCTWGRFCPFGTYLRTEKG